MKKLLLATAAIIAVSISSQGIAGGQAVRDEGRYGYNFNELLRCDYLYAHNNELHNKCIKNAPRYVPAEGYRAWYKTDVNGVHPHPNYDYLQH